MESSRLSIRRAEGSGRASESRMARCDLRPVACDVRGRTATCDLWLAVCEAATLGLRRVCGERGVCGARMAAVSLRSGCMSAVYSAKFFEKR